jgi:hypothetical protein
MIGQLFDKKRPGEKKFKFSRPRFLLSAERVESG